MKDKVQLSLSLILCPTWGYSLIRFALWYLFPLRFYVKNKIVFFFIQVVSSAIVDKYIGESARLIREMFNYARDHQPCIIFMDEIDAIGGRRFSEGTSADREIQRTLMELLNQMDGFDSLGQVKMIMATNRPDTLDPALLRPGRLDRKIEIPLPNEQARLDILKIHSGPITKRGEIGKLFKVTLF